MAKKVVLSAYFPSKRKRNNVSPILREERDIVPIPAQNIGKLLARQQAQGVEQCTSRTIPVQHDQAFGDPGVLGTVCQDGHLLMQKMLDANKSSLSSSTESTSE